MNIAIIGHTNIEKCHDKDDSDTYVYNQEAYHQTFKDIERLILSYIYNGKKITIVSGMARGVDEIVALIAIKHKLDLIICVPKSIEWYRNKTISTGLKIQALHFDEILKYKNLIKIIESNDNYDKGNYGYFLSRNQEIVNISNLLFSYKKFESQGTNDCIERGIKKGIYLGNLL